MVRNIVGPIRKRTLRWLAWAFWRIAERCNGAACRLFRRSMW
jgi:hypothetical protein